MCPAWIPSVTSARSAARFDARPTAAMMPASSRAFGEPRIRSAVFTRGCDAASGPTVDTAIGSSIEPWSVRSVTAQFVSGRYAPPRHAKACAPASIARQSLPVASATASTPFITPLL